MGGSFEGCWGSVQKVVFRIAWRWFQNFAGDAICVIIYFIAFHCIILLSGFRFERKKLSLLLLVIYLAFSGLFEKHCFVWKLHGRTASPSQKKSLHPTHSSCSLGVLFRQFLATLSGSLHFWQPQEAGGFFSKKIDFLFPSFCGEPNRHPKCFPVFTLAVAGGSPPCRPSRSRLTPRLGQVRHGLHRPRTPERSDLTYLTFKKKQRIWKYLEFT